MNKAYRFRIYPDEQQKVQLAKTFGCVRFVYNQCLEYQEKSFQAGKNYIRKFDMNNYCTQVLKKEYPFLKEIDKFAFNNTIFALDAAYMRFFEGNSNHPKFKSRKKSRCSYTTCFTLNNIEIGSDYIKLPKLKKVRAVIHCSIPDGWKIKFATVSMEKDETYYCSINFEFNSTDIKHSFNPEYIVGLDYKMNGLYIDSDGNECNAPRYFRSSKAKLAKAQRKLERKVGAKKGEVQSNNYKKQQKRVNKIYRKIANQRNDFLHKESAKITNLYDVVCIEDLNMRDMSNKSFGNGLSTMDNGYGMFVKMLTYKLEEKNKLLIKVDRWFPSSQTCSRCGSKTKIPLYSRKYVCPKCGLVIDRDYNAALNILYEGMRIFESITVDIA